MNRLLATLMLLLIAGCTPLSPAPQPQPSPTVDKLAQFEDENSIDTEAWYGHVTKADIENGAIWVYTDLPNTTAAKSLAGRMCGAYATYTMDDPTVDVVWVRAGDGMRLAKCGPGA